MNRSTYDVLKSWKTNPSRKPLLVQGARQVGKTYLLREFGRNEFQDCAYFNFEENRTLETLFEQDISPVKIIEYLSAYQGKPIKPGATLLFLDEIQACPRALTSLKYFCEQAPEYHLVAAGSLLGVSVGKTTSFPVGKVNFLTMYPLNFFEFLKVTGEEAVLELLANNHALTPIPELLHEKLAEMLRRYLFIGGMPEVVQTYLLSGDLRKVRIVQKEILESYKRDFSKYTTPTQAVRVSEVWHSIPAQLSRENKKFKYSDARKNGRASQFESAVEWLRGAGIMYTAVNVTAAKLPLIGYEDHSRYKAYVCDCGLLSAMVDMPAGAILAGNEIFSEYNGAFVENYVATELACKSEGSLHYWISEGIAEVDFLVVKDQMILPVEVKSGLHRNIKSLRLYADKYKPSRIYRTSPRNFYAHDDFINIPLYAIGSFPQPSPCLW